MPASEYTLLRRQATVDVTYFDADLDERDRFRRSAFLYSAVQPRRARARATGIEVAAALLVIAGLTLGAAYTYLDAKNDAGCEEIRRPPPLPAASTSTMPSTGGSGNFNLAAIYNWPAG